MMEPSGSPDPDSNLTYRESLPPDVLAGYLSVKGGGLGQYLSGRVSPKEGRTRDTCAGLISRSQEIGRLSPVDLDLALVTEFHRRTQLDEPLGRSPGAAQEERPVTKEPTEDTLIQFNALYLR